MLIRLKCILFLGIITLPIISQTSIDKRANNDQIFVKTWRALGPRLNNSIKTTSPTDITKNLSAAYKLEQNSLRSFLIYVLNYTSHQLTPVSVLYRYPHYNADSIQMDLDNLIELKLIEKRESLKAYTVSALGDKILQSYWKLRMEQVAHYDKLSSNQLDIICEVLEKVVSASLKIKGSHSAKVRVVSRPKNFNQLPKVIQASELLKEYTAYMNDVGHYKFDDLILQTTNSQWKVIKLEPLEKELLSATRNGRVYDLKRCYNQRNWRVGQSGCDEAVEALIEAGLIDRTDQSIKQTEKGNAISVAAGRQADEKLYKAWKGITVEEYEKFVEGINWILENFPE